MSKTETNTPEMHDRVLAAFLKSDEGKGLNAEHVSVNYIALGQWCVTLLSSAPSNAGARYSVEDGDDDRFTCSEGEGSTPFTLDEYDALCDVPINEENRAVLEALEPGEEATLDHNGRTTFRRLDGFEFEQVTVRSLAIEAEGKTTDDLVLALEEVLRLLREGFLSGGDENDAARYTFDVGPEENWRGWRRPDRMGIRGER
jgi:hypothetical protein